MGGRGGNHVLLVMRSPFQVIFLNYQFEWIRSEVKKWNESGFRPPLCTYKLNWARRTSWVWWDDWDDTVIQTQDSKFEPCRSKAEHATSRSRRLPTILTFTRGWGRNIFVSFKPPGPGTEPRTLAWKAAVLTTTLGPPPSCRSTTSTIKFRNRTVFLIVLMSNYSLRTLYHSYCNNPTDLLWRSRSLWPEYCYLLVKMSYHGYCDTHISKKWVIMVIVTHI